ncbi:protein kinase domain-containing protein [Halothece sp. PCC 7418]|uniref:protein kinase domain-containing protein n=1 Tax=Halothece sp. (strain PCC 7418) TaxID=65093 RepID=UPI00030B3181|nr:hypothetical protein [Halothece sp. PCC 7418]
MSAGQQWSEQAVIALLQDCLPLLDFIHSQSPPIIHRDIKPANLIRRGEDGKIVLVDFGAVKESFQTKLVQSTVAIGTRGYMPTEQIRGKPRPSSDIFALGMVAIQAITGVNPIDLPEDENGKVVWQQIENEAGELQPRVTVSSGLANVLSKMIHHDFKDRYQSAREVIEALEKLTTNSHAEETSVIMSEALNGITPTPGSVEKSQSETVSPQATTSPPEQETLKQNSTIAEQETLQQQPVAQDQSSSTPSQESSSMDQQSSPKTKANNNSMVTWLQSPLAKNLGIASVILILASVGMYSLDRHQTAQQKQQTQEQVATFQNEVTSLFEAKEYQDCLDKVDSDSGNDIQRIQELKVEFYGKCSLALAESFARAEQYSEALKLTEDIEPESGVYEQAQTQIQDWSNQLVEQGVSDYQKNGNLENFDNVVAALAPSNPVRESAIAQKQQLKQLHENNQNLLSTAQIALDNEQWQQAKEKAQQLQQVGKGYPYWQEQARLVLKDVEDGLANARSRSQPVATPPSSAKTGTPKPPSPRETTPSPSPSSTPKNTPSQPQEKEVVDLCQDEYAVEAGFCPQ